MRRRVSRRVNRVATWPRRRGCPSSPLILLSLTIGSSDHGRAHHADGSTAPATGPAKYPRGWPARRAMWSAGGWS